MAFEIVEFEKLIESQYITRSIQGCRRISNSGQGTKLSKIPFPVNYQTCHCNSMALC
jgi:hypothetical protein